MNPPHKIVLFALLLFSFFAGFGHVAYPAGIIVARATAAPAQGDLQLFSTEAAAQKHCPKDEVVWLNTPSGIYHEKGMRWYGNTKHGAYVCRKEADAAGDRDTRNGQ
jgi:hypothetical protein